MAVQYAIAHSNQVRGVAAIAAPGWGCADGRLATAVNSCMCNIHKDVHARNDLLDNMNDIDSPQLANVALTSEATKPEDMRSQEKRALKEAYIFYSEADTTVVPASAKAGVAFLADFLKSTPKVESIKTEGGMTIAQEPASHSWEPMDRPARPPHHDALKKRAHR